MIGGASRELKGWLYAHYIDSLVSWLVCRASAKRGEGLASHAASAAPSSASLRHSASGAGGRRARARPGRFRTPESTLPSSLAPRPRRSAAGRRRTPVQCSPLAGPPARRRREIPVSLVKQLCMI